MRVKTFEATSMQEALNVIKQDMGEDAFILSTRTRRRKDPLGPGGRLSSRSPPRWTTRCPPPVRRPSPCR